MSAWKKNGDTKCWRITGNVLTAVNRRFYGDGFVGATIGYPIPIYDNSASLESPLENQKLFMWYDWGWWDNAPYSSGTISGSNYLYYQRSDDNTIHEAFRPNSIGTNGGSGWGVYQLRSGSRYGTDADGTFISVNQYILGSVFAYKYPASCSLPPEWNLSNHTGSEISLKFQWTSGSQGLTSWQLLQFQNAATGLQTSVWLMKPAASAYAEVRYLSGASTITVSFTGSSIAQDYTSWHTLYVRLPDGGDTYARGGIDNNIVAISSPSLPSKLTQPSSLHIGGQPGSSQAKGISMYDLRIGIGSLTASYLSSSNSVNLIGNSYKDRKNNIEWFSYASSAEEPRRYRNSGSLSFDVPASLGGAGRCLPHPGLRNLLVNNDYTINTWVSKSLANTNRTICGIQGGGDIDGARIFEFLASSATALTFRMASGTVSNDYVFSGYSHPTGSWKMLTVSVERNLSNRYQFSASLYENGVFKSKVFGTGTMDTAVTKVAVSSSFFIGANIDDGSSQAQTTTRRWDGRIGDFRIYSGALSQTEITDLYNSSSWIYANDP